MPALLGMGMGTGNYPQIWTGMGMGTGNYPQIWTGMGPGTGTLVPTPLHARTLNIFYQ